jgi:hypothetical protein
MRPARAACAPLYRYKSRFIDYATGARDRRLPRPAGAWGEMTESILEFVRYVKDKKTFFLFCGRCESRFKKELPISMGNNLSRLTCPHCETDGFIIGQSSKGRR